ncbi:ROK family protein [Streptomyces virens]|uniref:ROK family protein n=1 Tax=Streptomyces virens TaxID=285572 RepID=A0ABP6P4I4_9ACTN|nr:MULTISPECIES: ROK family protein [Streptomyces]MBA8975835.1 glucokinase [Streptomyces calvus]MYS28525.1 ROK family protein [Streptomyces sp. SID7804]MYS30301.1 ROK family protein [Streptomyces sp. SID7804]
MLVNPLPAYAEHARPVPDGRHPVVALDIGGTKIAGALVAPDGQVLHKARRPTPAKEDETVLLAALADVIHDLRSTSVWEEVRAVGVGSTGPVDTAAGTVSPVNIPGWRSFPITEEVSRLTGGLPVRLVGDAVAMAMGEHWRGAARGAGNALCMVVSTGVGGGLLINGRIHPGPTGNAGHIGHISVEAGQERCACGARGCVEQAASGPSITRTALCLGWRPPPGEDATARAVAESAGRGDRAAIAAFDRGARALAAGVAATAHLLEVDLAVIGGGVAEAGPVLFAPLRSYLREYATLPFATACRVKPAALGGDAGLVGAAAAALAIHPEDDVKRPTAHPSGLVTADVPPGTARTGSG